MSEFLRYVPCAVVLTLEELSLVSGKIKEYGKLNKKSDKRQIKMKFTSFTGLPYLLAYLIYWLAQNSNSEFLLTGVASLSFTSHFSSGQEKL